MRWIIRNYDGRTLCGFVGSDPVWGDDTLGADPGTVEYDHDALMVALDTLVMRTRATGRIAIEIECVLSSRNDEGDKRK